MIHSFFLVPLLPLISFPTTPLPTLSLVSSDCGFSTYENVHQTMTGRAHGIVLGMKTYMGTRNNQPSNLSLDPKLHEWQRCKFILTLNLEPNSCVWEASNRRVV